MAIEIVKTINGVKQLVPLTTDSGQGLPLGAWTSFEDDKPRNGYLKADTTFDPSDYPALYNMLGTNVVPERFDHDRLGDYESITISTSSINPTIMEYDGFVSANCYSNTNNSIGIFVNGDSLIFISNDSSSSTVGLNIIAPVRKGDSVWIQGTLGVNVSNVKARFYKHPMFIKAVIGPIEDSAADQVVQNINNSRSYSTEEVNTGEKWIDGKPIYRKCYQGTLAGSGGGYSIQHNITNLDTVVKVESILLSGTNFVPSGFYNGNYYFSVFIEPLNLSFRYSNTYEGRDYQAFIEYTKTTDQATV